VLLRARHQLRNVLDRVVHRPLENVRRRAACRVAVDVATAVALREHTPVLIKAVQQRRGACNRVQLERDGGRFVEREPGRIEGAERRLAMAGQTPNWRRRGATLANRRPRILRRRFPALTPATLAG
jgi:hypothetical protein